MSKYAKTYQTMSNETVVHGNAEPHAIAALLTDGAIRFINEGVLALKQKKLGEKCQRVSRVLDITLALRTFLKMPEEEPALEGILTNMHDLLDFVDLTLTQANISNDETLFTDAIRVLRSIGECFAACGQNSNT